MAVGAEASDQELVVAAQRGQPHALEALLRRHERWVRGVVFAACGSPGLVDDVAQQVWMQAWQQIGSLGDPTRWRAWLGRLARHAAIDHGLANRRRLRLLRDAATQRGSPPAPVQPDEELSRGEERRRMLAAIQGLPPIYREAFVLRHLEDWSYVQIAEVTGIPIDTVETRLVRARRLLREALRGAANERDAVGGAIGEPAPARDLERGD